MFPMNIITESDFVEISKDHPLGMHFSTLKFRDGSVSSFPHRFFRNWLDEDIENSNFGHFYIGRNSGVGVGSVVKYDGDSQCLRLGRYVAGGLRLKFLLNGQHEIRGISSYMFSALGIGMNNPAPPQYRDTTIKNDVWIGDEVLFLGGSTIENGCVVGARTVVPPNFKSEPYGIYVGSPARLVRFRFAEKVRDALLDLAWWEMPISWLKDNNECFLKDLTADEAQSLELLAQLKESRISAVG